MGNKHSHSEIIDDIKLGIETYCKNDISQLVKSIDKITNKIITEFITSNKNKIKLDSTIIQRINFSHAVIEHTNIDLTNLSNIRTELKAISYIASNNQLSNTLQELIKNAISQRAATDSDLQAKIASANLLENLKEKTTDGEINNLIETVGNTIDNILSSSTSEDIKKTNISNIIKTNVINKINQKTDIENMINQMFKTDINTSNINNCIQETLVTQDIDFSSAVIKYDVIKNINNLNITLGSSCFLNGITSNNSLNDELTKYYTSTSAEDINKNRSANDESQQGTFIDKTINTIKSFLSDIMNNIAYIGIAIGIIVIGVIIFLVIKNKNVFTQKNINELSKNANIMQQPTNAVKSHSLNDLLLKKRI